LLLLLGRNLHRVVLTRRLLLLGLLLLGLLLLGLELLLLLLLRRRRLLGVGQKGEPSVCSAGEK
jgi:hypothetical protein